MGKIKSTLDLVMERTKNLSFTDEEKKEQKEKEAQKKIIGYIQKFSDELIKKEQFKKEIKRLDDADNVDYEKITIREIIKRLVIGKDNNSLFELLNDVFKIDIKPLLEVIDSYNQKINDFGEVRGTKRLDELSQKHGISGTAVIPNLLSDDIFRKKILEIRNTSDKMFALEKNKLC